MYMHTMRVSCFLLIFVSLVSPECIIGNDWDRYTNTLLEIYNKDPKDPTVLFTCAHNYFLRGELESALSFYERRLDAVGTEEEDFATLLGLAKTVEALVGDHDIQHQYTWQHAEKLYMQAYAMRPSRIEPLISIAKHYLNEGDFQRAYDYAMQSIGISEPLYDTLMCDMKAYRYTRYDIVCQACLQLGEFDKGKVALQELLAHDTYDDHVQEMHAVYAQHAYEQGPWHVQAINCGAVPDNQPEWSILICTLPERQESFTRLAKMLKKQVQDEHLEGRVEILYFLDERQFKTGFKRNKLLEESNGLYVNFVDDDDIVHDHYIRMIYDKLQLRPDCVSLAGIHTKDGANPTLFIYSINERYNQYRDGIYYGPPNHLNPIKRDIAIQYKFPLVNWAEDSCWAMQLVQDRVLKHEEVITEPYYFYIFKSNKVGCGADFPDNDKFVVLKD